MNFVTLSFVDDIIDWFDGVVASVGNWIVEALGEFLGKVCYYIVNALCGIVKVLYNVFAVFSGQNTVSYDGEEGYLINIFFGNKTVNGLYWGMAMLGVAMVFVFTMISVIRKIFDLYDKHQQPLGAILFSAGKSILTILLLSAVMTEVINLTNLLVQQVNLVFDNADHLTEKSEITFTDEQFATMARIYNTVGNYSLNASYNSRYNLNSCYNAIRPDMVLLMDEGVFDFYYDQSEGVTWQSCLQYLAKSGNMRVENKLDDYNEITAAIMKLMINLKTNASFYPIAEVKREIITTSEAVSLDRVVFLMGTLEAAKGGEGSYYNQNPSIQDALRGPYYTGKKDIYNINQVMNDFEISIAGIDYIIIGVLCYQTMKNLTVCIFNCIARIFNLMALYVVAPPIIATTPLDDGEKFKQWITSTVIQMFGIFGSIIPMRLVILFVPLIMDSRLVLFDSLTLNYLAKGVFIMGALEASTRFNGIFTGILANAAGQAAIHAGDMSDYAMKQFNTAKGGFERITGIKTVKNKMSQWGKSMDEHGGLVFGSAAFFSGKDKKKDGEDGDQKEGNKDLPENMGKTM